jgi:hypothetical protein
MNVFVFSNLYHLQNEKFIALEYLKFIYFISIKYFSFQNYDKKKNTMDKAFIEMQKLLFEIERVILKVLD